MMSLLNSIKNKVQILIFIEADKKKRQKTIKIESETRKKKFFRTSSQYTVKNEII